MKCVDCMHCINYAEGYYYCEITPGEIDLIEECIANDENMKCDMYVKDGYDDFTKICNQRIY